MFSSRSKTALCLVAGALLVPCGGTVGGPRLSAWAQEAVVRGATEPQLKAGWAKLQKDTAELEATDPRAAIARYQAFFEAGAFRFASVGLPLSLRIARLYQIDLKNYDKAIEIYDWALGLYKNQPDATLLQRGRLAAVEAQNRAEGAQPNGGLQPSTAGGAAPMAVVPKAAATGQLGVNLSPPMKGAGLGITLPTASNQNAMAVTLPLPPGRALGWQPGPQRCVTALAQQSDGSVWVATEDSGVWRYDPAAPAQNRWRQFTAQDGLGDNSAYALAVDKTGRVWAGTLNHGVSVWNGKEWRNYGVTEGPLGERVFDIAVCPLDGDVWIATNAGLTRYSVAQDSWSYFTRAQGLPSDQVQAIAFDPSGNLVLGTQCEGVAMASVAEGYKTWRTVSGPDKMPLTPTGAGLPSSLINDVLVARDGTIYAGTTLGLAWSRDGGANWRYVRGRDYAAKVRGLYGGAPKGWKEQPGAVLAEDYVTCLAQDGAGRLLVGHWVAGNEVVEMDGSQGKVKTIIEQQQTGFVRAILPVAGAKPLLARYDEGISQVLAGASSAPTLQARTGVARPTQAAFPFVAGAPTRDELQHLLELVRNHAHTPDATRITQLPDDWTTQGDWRGRYGRYWASLNAMLSPRNYVWGAGREPVYFAAKIGPNAANDDSLRYWIHTLYTDDRRALEMPTIYFHSRLIKGFTDWPDDPAKQKYRRQSEWDDHGEAYPLTKDGPDVYVTLKIPKGNFVLSLYNRNKDGHDGFNRARDYNISIRPHDYQKSLYETDDFDQRPEWAQARQRDFWGGEWKKFAVQGPQTFTVKVGRNYSFNTILAGVFLDEISEEPEPYFDAPAADAPIKTVSWQATNETPQDEAAEQLWTALESVKSDDVLWWSSQSRIFYQVLLRHYQEATTRTASAQMPALWSRLGTCYYQLNLYPQWEQMQQQRGLKPARTIEKALEWDEKSNFSGRGRTTIIAHRTGKSLTEAMLSSDLR